MAPFDFGGFSHQFTPASFIVKLNTAQSTGVRGRQSGLEKRVHKDMVSLILGYRGNVDKGDKCHYSSHTNVSLSKFNACYDCHYTVSTHCRRDNRNTLLS